MEEQERGEETEVDDDPARDRAVRAIGLTPDEHNGPLIGPGHAGVGR